MCQDKYLQSHAENQSTEIIGAYSKQQTTKTNKKNPEKQKLNLLEEILQNPANHLPPPPIKTHKKLFYLHHFISPDTPPQALPLVQVQKGRKPSCGEGITGQEEVGRNFSNQLGCWRKLQRILSTAVLLMPA